MNNRQKPINEIIASNLAAIANELHELNCNAEILVDIFHSIKVDLRKKEAKNLPDDE